MDNVILDVVLGLLLVYLVLALLASKVQEMWFGQMRSGRTRNLHKMLQEAVGHDGSLKDKILANPSIFALSEGNKKVATPGFWSAQGPSAIPPDLFARALLVVLYDDPQHSHPSKVYTPEAFVRNKAPALAAGAGQPGSVWGTLRALLPGHEADWPGFEAAIADWFKAVGERADGWYQRYAQNRSLWVALALAAMLNVDTFVLSDRLANDPELRRSLSTLAQNVNALFQQEQAAQRGEAAPATPPAALAPDLRAGKALDQAATLITSAYGDVAKFDTNFALMGDRKSTNAVVGECAKASTTPKEILNPDRQPSSNVFLSNPINWLYLIPTLQSEIQILRRPVRIQGDAAQDPTRDKISLVSIHDCIARMSGLVDLVAKRQAAGSSARENLNGAVTQLKLAVDALREWLADTSVPLSFKRLFQTDPEAFIRCSQDPTVSRDSLRQCVLAAQTGRVNLPFGWGDANRRLSLCHVEVESAPPVVVVAAGASAASTPALNTPAQRGMSDSLCGEHWRFDGNPALRLPRMQLAGPDAWRWLLLVLGLACTALFVALGAPFWFDVLGRVVKLRAAGSKAREDALTTPDNAAATAKKAGSGAAEDDADPSFAPERNVLEKILTAADLLALQAVLQVPRTGQLDKATRAAIETVSPKLGLPATDEVTLVLFQQLVGRLPEGLGSLNSPSASMKLGAADVRSPQVSWELMRLTAFPNRIAPPPPKVTDDLRALAVLWRYKREVTAGQALPNLTVATDANTRGKLDEITAADVSLLLSGNAVPAFAREAAPWMDWALGELGQREAQSPAATTRAASNPRILEYFAACGDNVSAEDVAWCAAFVSWVLQRHQVVDLGQAAAPGNAGSKFFGGPGSTFGSAPQPQWRAGDAWPPTAVASGDVVTLAQAARGVVDHVGFYMGSNATHVWVLSGNFSNRVGIDSFPMGQIVEIRRP